LTLLIDRLLLGLFGEPEFTVAFPELAPDRSLPPAPFSTLGTGLHVPLRVSQLKQACGLQPVIP
jgi:hypothetical protein